MVSPPPPVRGLARKRRWKKPIRPLPPEQVPRVPRLEEPHRDQVLRIPAGGGYRILRRPRMLDSEE